MEGNSLTIYGQAEGTGTLTISGVYEGYAGIGGGALADGQNCGTITINGGNITVAGGSWGAGIGGSRGGAGGTVTINSGDVHVKGGSQAAAIGRGTSGKGWPTTTINSGNIYLISGSGGQGLVGAITISGGNVIVAQLAQDYGSRYYHAVEGNLTLGWTNETDSFYAQSYSSSTTVSIKDGQMIADDNTYDSGTFYSGTLTSEQISAIAAKTLTPFTNNSHTVTIAESANGSITPDVTNAKFGDIITLTVKPDDGYGLYSVSYNFGRGDINITPDAQGVYSFKMPYMDVTVKPVFKVFTPYIDADGEPSGAVGAIPLDGTESSIAGGVYVVDRDITFDHTLTLEGDVTLILEDGKTMTIAPSGEGRGIDGYNLGQYSLTIYGQSAGTGRLSITTSGHFVSYSDYELGYSIDTSMYIQHGGTVEVSTSGGGKIVVAGVCDGIYAENVYITGGTVITNIAAKDSVGINGQSVNISGGKITANATGENSSGIGCNYNDTPMTLSLSRAEDFITASKYLGEFTLTLDDQTYTYPATTIKIADGQTLTDGTTDYSGTLTAEQMSGLAGKTLRLKIYRVSISGTGITADKSQAANGETVKLTYTGEIPAGYEAVYFVNGTPITGNTFKMPAADAEITANLTPIEYAITYHLDEGSLPEGVSNPASYTVESEDFTLNNPVRENYTFTGWTGSNGNTPQAEVEIRKGSTGKKEYYANWKQHGFIPEDPNTPAFAYHSMMLEGQLGVMFYMYIPSGYDPDNCTMDFDVSGDVKLNNPAQTYRKTRNLDGRTYYGYECYISSVQMADNIHAVLNYGEGLKISQDYSAEEYLNTPKDDEKDYELALLEAIRDYGHFAQLLLSQTHGWEIGRLHAEMPSNMIYSADEFSRVIDAVADYAIIRDTGNSGIDNVKFSLTFDANTIINLYLNVSDSYTGEVSVSGESCVLYKLSEKQYKVEITDIAAKQLDEIFSVNVTAGESFTVKVSGLSYVNIVLAENKDPVEMNAAVSLFRYHEAAKTYADKIRN